MASLLLLLLAGTSLSLGVAAPGSSKSINYENFTFRDETGRVVVDMRPQFSPRLRSRASSCKTDADGSDVIECLVFPDGRRLHIAQNPIPGCRNVTLSSPISDSGVSLSSIFPLNGANWYGGGEEIPQKWPLEKYENLTHAMVTMETANRGIQDPFWFNSDGMFIWVVPGSTLFMELNGEDSQDGLKISARDVPPYRNRAGFGLTLSYKVCQYSNAKEAFQAAVDLYLGKPTGYPDERMIKHPVWSTWARYKANINDSVVREFAKEIMDNGFDNSQLEIDDAWETCYGSKIVDTKRFPDMKKLTDDLKKDGFHVTIWTHPFINLDCTETLQEADSKGFLVKDMQGSYHTHWWNGNGSIIDFTKKGARDWFIQKHTDMMNTSGIDGFKFDAGETSWMPQLPDLETIPSAVDEDYPNIMTKQYVETCATFNSLTEVRSAYRSQNLPIFVRMIDKDSRWGDNNGLKSLVTTLLQMNMNGYSLVLPDMIGGNQYNGEVATKELFIRWLQANTFMPALQYALVPWDYGTDSAEVVAISKKFNAMHVKYSDIIIKAFKKNVADGSPVNPPIWWVDPTDKRALAEDSEYLLGEEILVAPVIEEKETKRAVYLPRGEWRDGNTKQVYNGPLTIWEYPAELDTLPFFVKVGSDAEKILNSTSASSHLAPLSFAVVLSLIVTAFY